MQSKFYFWGPILYHCKIQEDQIKKIFKICKKDKDLNYQNNLAGHIKNEYKINSTDLQTIIQKDINSFKECHSFYYKSNNHNKEFLIKDSWVNYMGPGDFNPPHTHGGNFSAVIFLDMPNEISKEAEVHNRAGVKSYSPGSITFIAGLGQQTTDDGLQSAWKKDFFCEAGEMFIFPSDLLHMVYPFKSNVERITVAYNMNFVEKKNKG